jgi:hypothetical protein
MRYWALFSCSGLITLAAYGVTESAELSANTTRPVERSRNFPPALVNAAPTEATPQAIPSQAIAPPVGSTTPVFSTTTAPVASSRPVSVAAIPTTVAPLPPGPTITLTPPPAPTFTTQQTQTHVPLPEPVLPLPTWSEGSEVPQTQVARRNVTRSTVAQRPIVETGSAEALVSPHSSVLTLATEPTAPSTEAELQPCQAWTPLPWAAAALTEDKVESNAAVCADGTNELAHSTPDATTAGTPIPGRVVSPTLNKPFTGVLQPGNVP